MGSKKSAKAKAPDPTPVAIQAGGQETQVAAQDERRRLQTQWGRQKTILAGDQSQQSGSRTLLGGNQ